MRVRGLSRRWVVRGLLVAAVGSLLLFAGVATASHDPTKLGSGKISEQPDNRTVISIQGFHIRGKANPKKPARLLAVEDGGDIAWREGSTPNQTWFYDVDPLENGNFLVTSTVPGDTVAFEYDPAADERIWTQRLDAKDTHDVAKLSEDEILVANMRNYNASASRNDDRIYVYNLTRDEITWEWYFRNEFGPKDGGFYREDWTHVNDVDIIDDHRVLLSPRNMDQVLVLNRTTREIELRLGSDDNHDVLYEQHNPDFFYDEEGNPTMLVGDSENDRVVEYTRVDGEWERTWTVTGFNWPRDADRLPNGNTLIVDTHNQRVVEVTPQGEVVWEFYAPWAPYDAERLGTGAESADGPAIRDMDAEGTYAVHGGSAGGALTQTPADWMITVTQGTPLEDDGEHFARRWAHVSPFFRPVWMSNWAFAALTVAFAISLPWSTVELVYQRRRVVAGLRSAAGRVRDARGQASDGDRAD
jgi:hypothetical protein